MTDIENMEAIELSAEEMNEVAGGAWRRLPEKKGFIIYQISKGETLGRIAKRFGYTVKDLLDWNPKIVDKNKIYYGDYLYIRA